MFFFNVERTNNCCYFGGNKLFCIWRNRFSCKLSALRPFTHLDIEWGLLTRPRKKILTFSFTFVPITNSNLVVLNVWFLRKRREAYSSGNAHLISHDPRSVWGLQRLMKTLGGTISDIGFFIIFSRKTGLLHGLYVLCDVFVHFGIDIFRKTQKYIFSFGLLQWELSSWCKIKAWTRSWEVA